MAAKVRFLGLRTRYLTFFMVRIAKKFYEVPPKCSKKLHL